MLGTCPTPFGAWSAVYCEDSPCLNQFRRQLANRNSWQLLPYTKMSATPEHRTLKIERGVSAHGNFNWKPDREQGNSGDRNLLLSWKDYLLEPSPNRSMSKKGNALCEASFTESRSNELSAHIYHLEIFYYYLSRKQIKDIKRLYK